MRDAFGGAFMINVFLVFIFIYICFTALALNYAKAFKVKNLMIEYLEKNEITDLNDLTSKELEQMETFIQEEIYGQMNYYVPGICTSENTDIKNDAGQKIGHCDQAGLIIKQVKPGKDEINTEGVYYTVSTYVGWSVPFLNMLLDLNGNNDEEEVITGYWEISGQTRLIVNG